MFTPRHDRGRVLIDVAMLADGGEAITDIECQGVTRPRCWVPLALGADAMADAARAHLGAVGQLSTRLPAHPRSGPNAGQLAKSPPPQQVWTQPAAGIEKGGHEGEAATGGIAGDDVHPDPTIGRHAQIGSARGTL